MISFVSILNIYFWNLLYFTDLWHNAATCAHCWQDQYGQNPYPKRTGWTAWHASFWWPSYCNVQQPKCRSCSNTWSVEIFESNFYWIYGSKITYINFQVFHLQPNKSLVQNNIDGISHNRELYKLLKDNLYSPNCCSLYSFEQLEQLLTDFIKCLQAHISASL